MRWQFTVMAVAATALITVGCARVKPRPQCDFYAYKENRAAAEAANIIRLAAQVPGSITDMPLNYANITDHKITNKVLVQSTRALRRDNGLLEARGRLVNCTDHTLQIEARATFFDATDLETEAPTAWRRFSLSGHAVQSVALISVNKRAARYLLEIREGS